MKEIENKELDINTKVTIPLLKMMNNVINELPLQFKNVIVMGGLGGCTSHEFANMNVLIEYNRPIYLISESNLAIALFRGRHKIHCRKDSHVSIIPLGNKCNNITTNGLRWNLNNQSLEFGKLVSTSNQAIEDVVDIEVSDTVLWIIDFQH